MNIIRYNTFNKVINEYHHIKNHLVNHNQSHESFNHWTDNTYGFIVVCTIDAVSFEINITNQQKKLLFDLKYPQ